MYQAEKGSRLFNMKCADDKNETAEISMSDGVLHQEMSQVGLMFPPSSNLLDYIRTKFEYYAV